VFQPQACTNMSQSKDRFEWEKQQLESVRGSGPLAKAKVFSKLSGPGWLQSAITLGGGSLASGLFLGVIGGYEMLWVQWMAMFFWGHHAMCHQLRHPFHRKVPF